jgi:hypothetical protein
MAPRYVLRWHNLNDGASPGDRARRHELWRRAWMCNNKVCLAQLVECNAFNLEVVGSSPMVDVQYFFVFVTNFFLLSIFFVYVADLSVQIYFSSSFFFIFMTDLFIHLDIFCFCFCLFKLRDASTMHISNPPYGSRSTL